MRKNKQIERNLGSGSGGRREEEMAGLNGILFRTGRWCLEVSCCGLDPAGPRLPVTSVSEPRHVCPADFQPDEV